MGITWSWTKIHFYHQNCSTFSVKLAMLVRNSYTSRCNFKSFWPGLPAFYHYLPSLPGRLDEFKKTIKNVLILSGCDAEWQECSESSLPAFERWISSWFDCFSVVIGLRYKHLLAWSTRRIRTSKQSSTGRTNPAGTRQVLAIRCTISYLNVLWNSFKI